MDSLPPRLLLEQEYKVIEERIGAFASTQRRIPFEVDEAPALTYEFVVGRNTAVRAVAFDFEEREWVILNEVGVTPVSGEQASSVDGIEENFAAISAELHEEISEWRSMSEDEINEWLRDELHNGDLDESFVELFNAENYE